MKYQELVDFIENRMMMSHIYQPLLIRTLVESGGSATLRQLAHAFLRQDESQLLYYENTIKRMPLRILKKHGVVSHEGDLVSLNIGSLDFVQRAKVMVLCEQKLQEFIQTRGLAIWDYRLLDEPVPDSLRYQVLKASGGKCALCGVSKDERPIDVDHIIPRSRGGKTVLENLQALCSKCNRSKRNLDNTDFRTSAPAFAAKDCSFCDPKRVATAINRNGTVVALEDKYPVTTGHTLILPIRHTPDYFSMTAEEKLHADELLRVMKNTIVTKDSSVTGFNVGTNCGEAAGQTVAHAHIHLIPRRAGDTTHPEGGVRGVIPSKMRYK